MKWIASSESAELAVEDASLLDLEDGMIVKHSGCPKLSWKTLQLFFQNGNSDKSLDFAYSTLLSYGLDMGARTTCLKMFMLHLLWVSLGSPRPFWCRGVVRPKPFAAAQCVLTTCHKTAVQTAATACLQIGGLYGGTQVKVPLGLPLGYIRFIDYYLLYLPV